MSKSPPVLPLHQDHHWKVNSTISTVSASSDDNSSDPDSQQRGHGQLGLLPSFRPTDGRCVGAGEATIINGNATSMVGSDATRAEATSSEGAGQYEVEEKKENTTWIQKIHSHRHRLRSMLEMPRYHKTVIGLVIADLVVIFIDLILSMLNLPCYTEAQIEWFAAQGLTHLAPAASCLLNDSAGVQKGDWLLWALSVALLVVFFADICASLFAFGLRRFYKPIFAIDALVIVASLIMEIVFKLDPSVTGAGSSPAALVLLRLWKIIRAIHAVAHAIEMKNQTIIRNVREAKAKLKEEHLAAEARLRRERWKIRFLLARMASLGDGRGEVVNEEDLECAADREMEREAEMERERERERLLDKKGRMSIDRSSFEERWTGVRSGLRMCKEWWSRKRSIVR